MSAGTNYWVVMAAAGASRRFGEATPKQHQALAGSTVLELALRLFCVDKRCLGIALALSPAALDNELLCSRLPAKATPIRGGARRVDSVLAGLESLSKRAQAQDWVLVHDAARPCLSEADLERLLQAGFAHPLGALLAAPVTDTLKRADATLGSECTVDRTSLWRAQTPQMFRYASLCAALREAGRAGRDPTDEAQAMEWQGGRPLLIAAQDSNIKITNRQDLAVAVAILAARVAEPEDAATGSRK